MLTAARLRELLSYDPETGVFKWRRAQGKRTDVVGRVAGSPTHGYVTIRIDYRLYPAHRLAWLHVTGRWPQGEIDHRDTDRSNNRFANLREATHQENARNSTERSTNVSGVTGVAWCSQTQRWRAHITIDGKTVHLGRFDTIGQAADARQKAATEHFGAFAPKAA